MNDISRNRREFSFPVNQWGACLKVSRSIFSNSLSI
ncbi:Uncharacterised protein [Vibrio cholerae]|nr:Uncharacterised protein [Vibrio cholerae]